MQSEVVGFTLPRQVRGEEKPLLPPGGGGSRWGGIIVWLGLFLATALMVVLMPMWVLADEEKGESEGGKPGIQLSGFMINGRFDLNYQKEQFSGNPEEGHDFFKNFHHFVFLSRRKKDEPFTFTAEVVDFTFFEVGVKLGKNRLLKFGKIFMPFGADPLFHHAYGGLTGFDQKLVPFVWTPYGGSFQYPIMDRTGLRVDNEFYVVPGFGGKPDTLIEINGKPDDGQVGAGDRLRVGMGKYSLWGSFFWNQTFSSKNMFMYGLDAAAAYGFLPIGPLSNLALKAGFIRADIRGSERTDTDGSAIDSYYHFGDYLQVDYKLPWDLRCRYRTGLVSVDNLKGLYLDDDQEGKKARRDKADKKDIRDRVSQNFGLWWDYKILSTGVEYFINLEAANEQPNDLIRLAAVIEF